MKHVGTTQDCMYFYFIKGEFVSVTNEQYNSSKLNGIDNVKISVHVFLPTRAIKCD
jgi:hypothetical protein